MKKKLFAIAAMAVALSMAFGFAACGDKDNSDETPPANQTTDDKTDDKKEEEKDPVYTKLTEAEWKKAFEDTLAAKTLTLELSSTYKGEKDDSTKVSEAGTIVMKYDLNKYIFYYESKYSATEGDQKDDSLDIICMEVVDTKFNTYTYSSYTESWTATSQDKTSAELAKKAFEDTFNTRYKQLGFTGDFTATIDGTEVKKTTLADLYGAFTFDEKADTYSAKLIINQMGGKREATYVLTFKDGKLSKMECPESKYIGEETTNVPSGESTATYAFGEVTITIPKEAKDALAAQSSGGSSSDNPPATQTNPDAGTNTNGDGD